MALFYTINNNNRNGNGKTYSQPASKKKREEKKMRIIKGESEYDLIPMSP